MLCAIPMSKMQDMYAACTLLMDAGKHVVEHTFPYSRVLSSFVWPSDQAARLPRHVKVLTLTK